MAAKFLSDPLASSAFDDSQRKLLEAFFEVQSEDKSTAEMQADNKLDSEYLRPSNLEEFEASVEWSDSQKNALDVFRKIRNSPELQEQVAEQAAQLGEDNRAVLRESLQGLGSRILEIKRDFELVNNTLIKFDNKKFHKLNPGDGTTGGDPIPPLQPQWKKHQDRFKELMNKSQETAASASYLAKDYKNVVLELLDNNEVEAAKTELENWAQKVESELQKNSHNLSKDFDDLRSEINTFKTELEMAIHDAEEHVERELADCRARIKGMEAEMAKFQTTATVGWLSLFSGGSAAIGVGVAIGLGLCAMTPVGWVLVALASIAAIGGLAAGVYGEVKKARTENTLEYLNDKLSKLTEQESEVAALKVLFTKADYKITSICNSINVISRIWSIFALEARSLKSALDDLASPVTEAGFRLRLAALKIDWEWMQTSLETYATLVSEAMPETE
ncbi:hypothetical protein PQX77_009591 [Marasmius sp. AFHP31]|nr:hypothetical protein PQX77_009591 [Marasmius sp. AFHP31]